MSASTSRLRVLWMALALTRWFRSSVVSAGVSDERERAEAQDGAGRPDDPLEPGGRKLVEVGAHLAIEMLHQAALIASRERVALDELLGQADDANLEALPPHNLRRRPDRDLDAAAADVDRNCRAGADVDPVARREMDEPGFFGA